MRVERLRPQRDRPGHVRAAQREPLLDVPGDGVLDEVAVLGEVRRVGRDEGDGAQGLERLVGDGQVGLRVDDRAAEPGQHGPARLQRGGHRRLHRQVAEVAAPRHARPGDVDVERVLEVGRQVSGQRARVARIVTGHRAQ